MNGELEADNLEAKIDENTQTATIEPSYLGFLRENGFIVDSLNSVHTVQREKSKIPHLVVNVRTYDKPKDHPELDVAADGIDLWVCDCWSFRSNSADVSEGEPPSSSQPCDHIRRVSKIEQAKADENQKELQ